MKNIFYLFSGLAVAALGQQAMAGWYDDVGASVLTAQQAEPLPTPDTIVDQVPEKIELGKPGIQAGAKTEPVADDSAPPPPEPVPDHSISDAPMIESQPQQAPVASGDADPSIHSEPVIMPETAPRAAVTPVTENSPHVHYHQHRHVPKKKSVIQKLIDCERKKNAWIKRHLFGH